MARAYDNWGRLVEAVCRREQLRQLCLEDSRSPSTRSFDSDFSFSFSSSSQSFRIPPSPLNPDLLKLKLMEEGKKSGTGKRRWKKGFSIFNGFSFSSKKEGVDKTELKWAHAQRTLHGLHKPMKTDGDLGKSSYEERFRISEEAKRRSQMARLQEHRELHTLKNHIEFLVKTKGLDLDSIHVYHTI